MFQHDLTLQCLALLPQSQHNPKHHARTHSNVPKNNRLTHHAMHSATHIHNPHEQHKSPTSKHFDNNAPTVQVVCTVHPESKSHHSGVPQWWFAKLVLYRNTPQIMRLWMTLDCLYPKTYTTKSKWMLSCTDLYILTHNTTEATHPSQQQTRIGALATHHLTRTH